MLVVCSLLAMIFVLFHCHPAAKKLCPHAEIMLAFRDHGIITTSSNKTEPNITYTNRLVLISAHNHLEANIIWRTKVFFVFSYERSRLVALFTGVDIHVHYA